jgi:hypothetical protein
MTTRKTDINYRYGIPAEVTVQIDTREKYPMLFPETVKIGHPELSYKAVPIFVKQERVALPFGDYRLKEYPDICVFERKASQLELFKNLMESSDRIRQAKAFRKLMCGCKAPYLLIEASPAELLGTGTVKHPEVLCNRLSLAIAKYGLSALFLPWKSRSPDTRRKVGTFMVHIMLGHALHAVFDVPPVLLEENDEEA